MAVEYPSRKVYPDGDSRWRSRERVYETDADGRRKLLYAEGAPIPEDEARRQGLVNGAEDKAVDRVKDKAVKRAENKAPTATKAKKE